MPWEKQAPRRGQGGSHCTAKRDARGSRRPRVDGEISPPTGRISRIPERTHRGSLAGSRLPVRGTGTAVRGTRHGLSPSLCLSFRRCRARRRRCDRPCASGPSCDPGCAALDRCSAAVAVLHDGPSAGLRTRSPTSDSRGARAGLGTPGRSQDPDRTVVAHGGRDRAALRHDGQQHDGHLRATALHGPSAHRRDLVDDDRHLFPVRIDAGRRRLDARSLRLRSHRGPARSRRRAGRGRAAPLRHRAARHRFRRRRGLLLGVSLEGDCPSLRRGLRTIANAPRSRQEGRRRRTPFAHRADTRGGGPRALRRRPRQGAWRRGRRPERPLGGHRGTRWRGRHLE